MQRTYLTRRAMSRALTQTAVAASLAAGIVLALQGRAALADQISPIALLSYCQASNAAASAGTVASCQWVHRSDRDRADSADSAPATKVYLALARAFLNAGDPASAIAQYRSALEGEPDNPALYALLGKAQDRLGRHAEAQQTYMAGLDHAPDSAVLFDLLDQSLMTSEATRQVTIAAALSGQTMSVVAGCEPASHGSPSGTWEVGDHREHATVCRSDLTVDDLLDVVNPLQHLPVVATLYRRASGDEIDGAARILGGALFGGPLGMFSSAIEHFFEESTGSDFGEMALALFDTPVEQDAPVVAEIPPWRRMP